jgi:hypothetical protein
MPKPPLKLLLPELEAEVVAEALELYVFTRGVSLDYSHAHRQRAARAVLEVLQQSVPDEDDPLPGRRRAPLED